MAADRSRLLAVALFLTLALVGAFLVSVVASRVGDAGDGRDRPGWAGADPGAPQAPDTPAHADIRVEVLNGAGTPGLAREVTHRLRDAGFDVVYFGNAGRFDHRRSVVLDRVEDPPRARAVAAALGIDTVAVAVDSTLLLDVSVVLGDDWPLLPETPDGRWTDRARQWIAPDSGG